MFVNRVTVYLTGARNMVKYGKSLMWKNKVLSHESWLRTLLSTLNCSSWPMSNIQISKVFSLINHDLWGKSNSQIKKKTQVNK